MMTGQNPLAAVAARSGVGTGRSSRLMAHRLSVCGDAAEAKRYGAGFEEAWLALHGGAAPAKGQVATLPQATRALAPTVADCAPIAQPVKAQPAPAAASPAPPPKPMPVPAEIAALGSAPTDAYRSSFRAANNRALRLLAHPTARHRNLAVMDLVTQGLDDDAIFARLPEQLTDQQHRSRAAADAAWSKAYGLGAPKPPQGHGSFRTSTTDARAKVDGVWDRAYRAANAEGGPRQAQAGGNARAAADAVWDRVNAKRDALVAHLDHEGGK
ncbi:hypothetical protein BV98_002216 [Sphingobium herbicidovorans NBRC 16415]|uniref:Uncharacterized protein n=1 Tax=Sphingobium herbicidovorans (strain ATCC 700291 / DSM 11019 / CCUG 56400 / KCTC 2939 / LMG 18315 / NBRC 16415 / MH) TaxID=1219045 RepID=A0A086P9H5_SPHHM|nr:hypothetical protein BV98_002216 [Sphingobium herbicidovorans NBRC 16415]